MSTRRKHKFLRHHLLDETRQAHRLPLHDPPLAPHDEAVFLLHIAAEVEHALMVQYLYAAFSLKNPEDLPQERQPLARKWRKTLLGIAREEMGHLITVQNLLRLIGGPITLEREDYPFRGDLYPFHFRLEPLTRESLARYVVAEMPCIDEPDEELKGVLHRAGADTVPINRVGALYLRVAHIFSAPSPGGDHEPHLRDSDFQPDAAERQAHYAHWGNGASVLVPEVRDRAQALAAIQELSEQGEGVTDSDAPSHYQRFLNIYREFPEPGDGWEPSYPVPTDPLTGQGGTEAGRIAHPRSRLWAQMSNTRYRMLLNYLAHFLQSEGDLFDPSGNYTPRGYLNKWTFDEMRHVSQTAGLLATLPRVEGQPDPPDRAGAPFELPYTLTLPSSETDRWRQHMDVLAASVALAHDIGHHERAEGPGMDLLSNLSQADKLALEVARAAMQGSDLPARPEGFRGVIGILEDAVRGFRIGVHHNFWLGVTRDQFVEMSVFGNPLIARAEDGTFDPDSSNLIKALRGEPPFDATDEASESASRYPRMPAHHPPVPDILIAHVRRWIAAGCPE